MKVIKKINNNVALCKDAKGNEVIALGKGVGFRGENYELKLSEIEQTFYNLDSRFINMFNDISFETFQIADKIVNYAIDKLVCELNANLIFTLADHIDFAIERYHKNIQFKLPIINDIEYFFDLEMKVGRYGLAVIKKELAIELPEDEAVAIALNIINSEYNTLKPALKINDKVIEKITEIIESVFQIKVDRKSFSYSRFVTHMYYLLKRKSTDSPIDANKENIYQTLINTYPKSYHCVKLIKEYINKELNWTLSKEEKMYLMLHVNRLSDRTDS